MEVSHTFVSGVKFQRKFFFYHVRTCDLLNGIEAIIIIGCDLFVIKCVFFIVYNTLPPLVCASSCVWEGTRIQAELNEVTEQSVLSADKPDSVLMFGFVWVFRNA